MLVRSIVGMFPLEDGNTSTSLRAVRHTLLLGFPPLGDQHIPII